MSAYWNLVEHAARERPSSLVAEDTHGRSLTVVELRDQAVAFAGALRESSIGEGSVVAWQLPSSIEAIVTIAGLARLGVVQVPLVPIYRRREVEFIVRQTGATLLVVAPEIRGFDHAGLAREVASEVGGVEVLVLGREGLPRPDGVDALPAAGSSSGDQQIRWLFYTSGTVAEPKGARHTDATLIAAATAYVEAIGFRPDDRSGVTFPLSHIGGPTSLAATLIGGYPMVLEEAFDPERTPAWFAERGVTHVSGPPIVHQAFLAAQRAHGSGRAFPTMRAFLGGGTPKPPGLSEALRTELGVPLLSGYGATESPLATFCRPDDDPAVLDHTEGRPLGDVVLRVVDERGRVVGPGEVGELRLGGSQTFLGYVDPALVEDAFDDQGCFRTGDLGYVDEAGNVVITGRLKEIIIRKGENLSAREIQEVILAHPGIADAAVIGLPDPDTGERACAIVVARSGRPVVTLDDLAAHCRAAGLMNQKIPEQLEIVDELPRNAMGKVMVAALRECYSDPARRSRRRRMTEVDQHL